MHITDDIRYVGVYDHDIDLFEGLHPVSEGVSYNSYVIMDEKIAVMDSVDAHFGGAWITHLHTVLNGRTPDFLIVHHMEPDHSASIALFMTTFPDAIIVSSAKAFPMMKAFFGEDYASRRMIIKEGDRLCLGKHTLSFVAAPMVHWPEVMMTYDQQDRVIFSADAFGKFGTLDPSSDWSGEARRYYFAIVAKYGAQVQSVLKKLAAMDIQTICPLHGPVIENSMLAEAFRLYDLWSSYKPEEHGVVIAHASIYGNTRLAAEKLADTLVARGVKVILHDLTRCNVSAAVADAFRYDQLVLAASTYNAEVFPPMRNFINSLTERGYRGRSIGLIENGSWAPMAAKVMRSMLETSKDLTILEPVVRIQSALSPDISALLQQLSDSLS